MLITDWTPEAIKDLHRDKFIFDFSDDPGKLQEMPLYAAYYLLGCLLFRARQHLLRRIHDDTRPEDLDPQFLSNILCFLLTIRLAEIDGKLVPNQFDDSELICEFSEFNRDFTIIYKIGSFSTFGRSTVEINDMEWQDHAPEFRLLTVTALIKALARNAVKIAPIVAPNVGGLTNG